MERLSLNENYSYTEFQLGRGILNFIEIHCARCSIRMYKHTMMNVLNGIVQENYICYSCGELRSGDQKQNGSEKI